MGLVTSSRWGAERAHRDDGVERWLLGCYHHQCNVHFPIISSVVKVRKRRHREGSTLHLFTSGWSTVAGSDGCENFSLFLYWLVNSYLEPLECLPPPPPPGSTLRPPDHPMVHQSVPNSTPKRAYQKSKSDGVCIFGEGNLRSQMFIYSLS